MLKKVFLSTSLFEQTKYHSASVMLGRHHRNSSTTANSIRQPDATEKHSPPRIVLFATNQTAQKRSTQAYANKLHAE